MYSHELNSASEMLKTDLRRKCADCFLVCSLFSPDSVLMKSTPPETFSVEDNRMRPVEKIPHCLCRVSDNVTSDNVIITVNVLL